jgi:hypothetical protein
VILLWKVVVVEELAKNFCAKARASSRIEKKGKSAVGNRY